MAIIEELKHRNVFKVSIAYIVMAWLVMQVADVVLNNITAPEWVFHVVLLFLAIGLPFAVFFAWEFELTPEGLKREHEVDRSQSIAHVTGRKLDFVIISVLVLALGYFAVDKFVFDPTRDAELVQATTETVTEQVAAEPEASSESDKSIAVLPFVNMSDDASNEYFSDSISEELLNLLSKIPELRVISRTSAFSFKGKEIDIPTIAQQLNVAHILEGSVRKAGNQVRITAQLIEVRSDSHMWSETYDRTLDDIFAIQDEIAAAVVDALKLTLLGDAPEVQQISPEAYALYLQAMYLNAQGNAEAYEQSIALYKQALAIAPDYVAAWQGLVVNYGRQVSDGLLPLVKGYALQAEAINQSLAIDPDSAEAHTSLGYFSMNYDHDLAAAARHFKYALSQEPTNLTVIHGCASLMFRLGRLEEAIALREYRVAHDPLGPVGHTSLAGAYLWAGRPDEAIASSRTALMLAPGRRGAQSMLGMALLLKGETEAALEAIQQAPAEVYRLSGLVRIYHALGRADESDAALSEFIEKYEQERPLIIASMLAYRGEADRAFTWLDKAVQYKDTRLTWVAVSPWFAASIQDDPRWLPFLESIGMSPVQLDAIEFTVTLPK